MTPEPFLTAEEVAAHLKITRPQALEMARKGVIPAHPVCRNAASTGPVRPHQGVDEQRSPARLAASEPR